jgi:glycosyltransferase involved in cell wall biosynthesis
MVGPCLHRGQLPECPITSGAGAMRARAPVGEPAFRSIVHVTERGGSFGGTEEYISLVTGELHRRGVRSHLVCGLLGDVPAELDSVHVVEGLAERRPARPSGPELVRLADELAADVVYLHNVFDPDAVAALAARPGRGPLLWYVHDHYPTCLTELRWRRDVGACEQRLGAGCLTALAGGHCVRRHADTVLDPAELGRRTALSRALRHVDEVVVVSEHMRSLLLDAEPDLAGRIALLARPVRPLAGGVGGSGAGGRRRRRVGDPAVVAFAGRITPEKGLDVAIRALARLRATHPVELRIAGPVEHGDHWARCRRLAGEAMAANPHLDVRYLGHLPYPAVDALFAAADVVLVPSQWPEPFGAVALEAMSAGAAVVASRVGGLGTCITDDDTGTLVPPGDTTAWVAAIDRLLADPDAAARLAQRGRRRALEHSAAGHVDALDEVVRRHRRPRRTLHLRADVTVLTDTDTPQPDPSS